MDLLTLQHPIGSEDDDDDGLRAAAGCLFAIAVMMSVFCALAILLRFVLR